MKVRFHETMTSTDFARHVASTIDHVRMSGTVVEITKGNQTIARLMPPAQKGVPIQQLKNLFEKLPKIDHLDGARMAQDLKNIRSDADLPDSSWE